MQFHRGMEANPQKKKAPETEFRKPFSYQFGD